MGGLLGGKMMVSRTEIKRSEEDIRSGGKADKGIWPHSNSITPSVED